MLGFQLDLGDAHEFAGAGGGFEAGEEGEFRVVDLLGWVSESVWGVGGYWVWRVMKGTGE